MKERFYFIETAIKVLRNAGFEGLACDPDAFECRGCPLDRINPDECLNPDCHGAYIDEDEIGTFYQTRRKFR